MKLEHAHFRIHYFNKGNRQWVIHVPGIDNKPGDVVKITRHNGTKTKVRIAEILHTLTDYQIAKFYSVN